MAILKFAHILWEASKPTIVLTHRKSVDRFNQTKAFPPSFWNACEYVLQSKAQNTTYCWFSQHSSWASLQNRKQNHGEGPSQNPGGCTKNALCVHIPLRCCWRTFSLHTAGWSRWDWRKNAWKEKTLSENGNRMGSTWKTIFNEAKYQRIHQDWRKYYVSYSKHAVKEKARIGLEQDVDIILKTLNLKTLGQPHDEVLLTTDKRFQHYKANGDRIILKEELLYRKYYGETGTIKYYQILVPQQKVDEVLRSLHGEIGPRPRDTKTIFACRQKYHYPNMAQLIRQWVISCQQCIRESRIDTRLTGTALQNPIENNTAPEDAMRSDLIPDLPPSGGYEKIVTAMNVFSRYLFDYTISRQDAKTIAKVIINTMTKDAYLPTTTISDKGSVFISQVITDVAEVLGITLQFATTKDAQTDGMLERTHASVMKTLKVETGVRRSMWHKFVNIAVLNYNTSYHSSLG